MRKMKFRGWFAPQKAWITLEETPDLYNNVMLRALLSEGNTAWCQSTGLIDKNGREIYEGDITKWHYGGNWVVEWHTGESRIGEVDDEWGDTVGFYITNHKTNPENGYRNYEPLASDRIYVVIGNIYENPELMEVK